MHKVSPPKLQTMMMDKYLENPVNPLMLIEYDQRDDRLLKRTIYVKEAYNKLKENSFALDSQLKGNLLCIGDPNIGKSYLLNKMFNLQFELNQKGSYGLFHDSVDVTFAVADVLPMDVNVFDFQGERANADFTMICDMFEYLPLTYMLVQVSDAQYLDALNSELRKRGKKLLQKFKERSIFITRSAEKGDELKDKILDDFDLQSDNKIFDVDDRGKLLQ